MEAREVVGVVAGIAVGVAFVVAAVSKLIARESWATQASGLGAPRWSVPIVPYVELVVGALLVTTIARRAVALVALGLLGAFTVLLAHNLRQGRRPPCACFGAWSARPIGAGHLVRNAVLMLLAVVAAVA